MNVIARRAEIARIVLIIGQKILISAKDAVLISRKEIIQRRDLINHNSTKKLTMKKFNVIKRYSIADVPVMSFVSDMRGITLLQAEMLLSETFLNQSSLMFQDVSEIDYISHEYPRFTVINNGVEFTYSIEEDWASTILSSMYSPSIRNITNLN